MIMSSLPCTYVYIYTLIYIILFLDTYVDVLSQTYIKWKYTIKAFICYAYLGLSAEIYNTYTQLQLSSKRNGIDSLSYHLFEIIMIFASNAAKITLFLPKPVESRQGAANHDYRPEQSKGA